MNIQLSLNLNFANGIPTSAFFTFKYKFILLTFLEFVNGEHASLKFTSKSEVDIHLPCLYDQLIRLPVKIATLLYSKPTFTGMSEFFFYFFTLILKSIATLFHEAHDNNWDDFTLHREFETLADLFSYNGFLKKLVCDYIGRFLILKCSSSKDTLFEQYFTFMSRTSIPYSRYNFHWSDLCNLCFFQICVVNFNCTVFTLRLFFLLHVNIHVHQLNKYCTPPFAQ